MNSNAQSEASFVIQHDQVNDLEELFGGDVSTEMYDIYCINLRARKVGDKFQLNYRKIMPDENIQIVHIKNEEYIKTWYNRYKREIYYVADKLN